MLITELFENTWSGPDNAWSGPNNAWHNQGSPGQWYDGKDQWHSEQGAGMVEDFSVTNLVQTNEMAEEMSDIVSARELIGQAMQDPDKRYQYIKFLKHLRDRHGPKYSTRIHKRAAKLARQEQK